MNLARHRYEAIPPISRDEALRLLERGTPLDRSRALLGLALHDSDWRWVQNLSLDHLGDSDPAIRATAALALAHLARIHGKLDLETVLPALNSLKEDPVIGGRVEDALSDISIFASDGSDG